VGGRGWRWCYELGLCYCPVSCRALLSCVVYRVVVRRASCVVRDVDIFDWLPRYRCTACGVDVCVLCAGRCHSHGHGHDRPSTLVRLGLSSGPRSCVCPKGTCRCIDSVGALDRVISLYVVPVATMEPCTPPRPRPFVARYWRCRPLVHHHLLYILFPPCFEPVSGTNQGRWQCQMVPLQ
jgi:hypothetical protein